MNLASGINNFFVNQIHKEVQREKTQQQLMNEFVPGRDNRGARDGRDRERENSGPVSLSRKHLERILNIFTTYVKFTHWS